jgi:hypothetical protein
MITPSSTEVFEEQSMQVKVTKAGCGCGNKDAIKRALNK